MSNENKVTTSVSAGSQDTGDKKSYFVSKAVIWFVVSVVLPILAINYKFPLFTKKEEELHFTGWGLIAILVVFFAIYFVLKWVCESLEYSYTIQVLNGFRKIVMPLIALFFIFRTVNDNINGFIFITGVFIICELIGIFINPFPKWVYYKKKNRRMNEMEEAVRNANK